MFKTDDHHDGLVVGLSKREKERETSKQTNKQKKAAAAALREKEKILSLLLNF